MLALQRLVGNRTVTQLVKQGTPMLQRQSRGGTQGSQARVRAHVTMHFDGRDLIVREGEQEKFRFSAQSGRPVPLDSQHAQECGADPATDTYMNDKRFVGIKDFGPIPEGTYRLQPANIERYSFGEQLRLQWGGIVGQESVTVGSTSMHPGDWGSGRVVLIKQGRVAEGPCGNANTRSGFFLHGGILAGSSGCIDIGTSFSRLAEYLTDYPRPIQVTVRYEHAPPRIGFFTGLSGSLAYGRFRFGHGPRLRLGTEFAGGETRALASVGYDAILSWAGGALSAGVHLDVPFTDREAFVRYGLRGGADFRVFGPLFGQLFGGYTWTPQGGTTQGSAQLGAGIKYELGRVQLEALYNTLLRSSEDERVHQALVGVGFQF